jgi:hypothetical protein
MVVVVVSQLMQLEAWVDENCPELNLLCFCFMDDIVRGVKVAAQLG